MTLEDLEEFQSELSSLMELHEVPGLGVVLATSERVIWAGGLGVANKEGGQRVTERTVFRIGSISKSLVALSAMILVEEAKLDLQSPLRELAPEIRFQNRWAEEHPVRILHLMEHTTGWDDLALREYSHNVEPPISLREGLAFDPHSRTSRWPPGQSMSYCNSGPAVAAYVIGKLAGQDYEEFVRERIFDPLKMPHTSFRAEGEVKERLARGYKEGEPVEYWNLLQRPSGAINTTPKEFANYLRLFLREGELDGVRLVKPESIDRMMEARSPRAVRSGAEQWYGLHLVRYCSGGQVWYGHSGRLDGYLADMAWCPELDVGYAFMINTSTGEGFSKLRKEFRRFLVKGQNPRKLPSVPEIEVEVLASYAGYYQAVMPRRERRRFLAPFWGMVQVEAVDAGLKLTALNGWKREARKLLPLSDRVFRRPKDHLASAVFFDGEDEGRASFSISSEYQRVPKALVWTRWILAGTALILMATTIPFALIWVPRLVFGRRLREEPFLSVRVLPLICTLSFVACLAILSEGQSDEIGNFGRMSPWSLGFFVSTLFFAISAAAGLGVAFSAKRSSIRRGVRWHSLLVASAQTMLAFYLAYWGLLGLRSWV
jgi:CubicO group peptidase (beta-lactamase class C family)